MSITEIEGYRVTCNGCNCVLPTIKESPYLAANNARHRGWTTDFEREEPFKTLDFCPDCTLKRAQQKKEAESTKGSSEARSTRSEAPF